MPMEALPERPFELVATHHVLTLHLGVSGNLFGGMMLAWVDEAAALFAHKAADNRFVTYELDRVRFLRPCCCGDIVELSGRLVGMSKSGLEVELKAERLEGAEKELVLTTKAVMVAVDGEGRKAGLRMRGV